LGTNTITRNCDVEIQNGPELSSQKACCLLQFKPVKTGTSQLHVF